MSAETDQGGTGRKTQFIIFLIIHVFMKLSL